MPNIASAQVGNARVRRVRINARAIAVVGLLAAVPVLLSPVATAEPAPDVPSIPAVDPAAECATPEVDGVYIAEPPAPDGVARSVCQYIVEGSFYYDNYENGLYTGTLVYRDGAKVPTERPKLPEVLNLPGGLPVPLIPSGAF